MSKTRKILATLTMVAVTATASLTAVSSAQAHSAGPPHLHVTPGTLIPGPGPVYTGPLLPGPGPVFTGPLFPGPLSPSPTPTPPAPHPSHKHKHKYGQTAAFALLGGVLIGALANANRRPAQPVQPAGFPAAHYVYCDAKYKTYRIATNTFTGYDMKPHYCISPYI